ncbi:MAG: Uma2 family endonuclease, partial [Merismopedia sp. SIO2A8]|nr:Uma2 family endonuclease [Merismopedia sp. SIO2A8]
MLAQTQEKKYTTNEYLELELASEERHEYRNGVIISMTGGTPNHNFISGNLYIALSLALKRKPFALFHVDQRLWIPDSEIYTYPDVMVSPKPIQLQTGRKDTVTNPCLIAEVLSKSTQNYDRGAKFVAYRTIPSFQEYILIDQSQIHVEHYVKTGDNQWLFSEYDDGEIALTLQTLNIELAIADIYEDVELVKDETLSGT